MSIDFENFQIGMADLTKALKQFKGDGESVTIGIHEAAGNVESGTITQAQLGAINHFGADINHPGGTEYGYATEEAARDGDVRFLKTGTGYATLGVTKPHQIKIPPRPWLDVGVLSGADEYEKALQDLQPATLTDALRVVGVEAVGAVKDYMNELRDPPNAKSTVAKKGSSNPLIDSGEMRNSVNFVVTKSQLEEGL